MKKQQIELFFERLHKANPKPTTELVFNSNFELLVAVMLSAQSTDVEVNKVCGPLFQAAPDAASMLKLGQKKVRKMISSLGLFNNKSANLIKACKILQEKHDGKVPSSREDLEELPGVGRKTANVVLNTAFGMETMAVDTHIFRVANRTKLAPGKNVREVEDKLIRRVPQKYLKDAHHWLILHGRYVCKARKPLCDECLAVDICPYKPKNLKPETP